MFSFTGSKNSFWGISNFYGKGAIFVLYSMEDCHRQMEGRVRGGLKTTNSLPYYEVNNISY
jgi:hypothetical protein